MTIAKWLVIVNPNAGAGKCGKDWPLIDKILKKEGFEYDAILTSKRLHAMVIARSGIREGYRKMIIVGGDGTLNETINGIFAQKEIQTTEITLGMIPVGTGNDWARMFRIPPDYHKAVLTIKKEKTFIQDAGKVIFMKKDRKLNRYFINIAGIGFDAMVTLRSNALKEKGKRSPFLYFWNILLGLFGYRYFNAMVDVDGTVYETDIFSMNIGICKYNGGGMMQLPEAVPDDGIFDLTIIKRIRKIEIIRSLPKLYNGKINKHPRVLSCNGKNITIQATRNVMLETDGESLGHTPIQFEIIPRSVKVITGKKTA